MQKARGDTEQFSVTVAYRLFSMVCTNSPCGRRSRGEKIKMERSARKSSLSCTPCGGFASLKGQPHVSLLDLRGPTGFVAFLLVLLFLSLLVCVVWCCFCL